MRGDQLSRQWRLLQFLGRPPGLAVEDAARELGCAVRTVWRDLRVLQQAGFPIYDEREGRRGVWKVEVGHCHLRGEVRVFAVERIRAVTALPDTFAMPEAFDAEAYLRGAWGIVRGDLVTVRAVFSPAVAPHVRGRLWHASQELRELSGGRLELRMTVADTLEVRRWLLGFGAEVEVLAPPALREAIRREAERMALALARKPLARAAAARTRTRRRRTTPQALGRPR